MSLPSCINKVLKQEKLSHEISLRSIRAQKHQISYSNQRIRARIWLLKSEEQSLSQKIDKTRVLANQIIKAKEGRQQRLIAEIKVAKNDE